MTSTVGGLDGSSLGWVNRPAFISRKDPKFTNYGAEERLWLGPEGGQFSLYFKPGSDFPGFSHSLRGCHKYPGKIPEFPIALFGVPRVRVRPGIDRVTGPGVVFTGPLVPIAIRGHRADLYVPAAADRAAILPYLELFSRGSITEKNRTIIKFNNFLKYGL